MADRHFTHDCDQCEFLGSVLLAPCEHHDLYFCAQGAWSTVIARFGDHETEYTSGLVFGVRGLVPQLEIALARALIRKLITVEQALKFL